MGANNRVGIGLPYRPARAIILYTFLEPRNRLHGIDFASLAGWYGNRKVAGGGRVMIVTNFDRRSCGAMDNASDYESEDCRFESCQDRCFLVWQESIRGDGVGHRRSCGANTDVRNGRH
jgi:hypothetical protein